MTLVQERTHAIHGTAPARVARATSVEDVVATLRGANERNEGVVPTGGGTRLSVGNALRRYDVALDLSALAGVAEHEPADLTATVRAGTTLAALREHLAEHGQMWPVEAGQPERATVGGVLAGAAAGPSRLAYFHPRDWTVGIRAVLGDGTPTKAGGRVVKNVTAYDLTRFYAGSYGTLCVIVEASLKLWPLAEAERTLVARFADLDAARTGLDALRDERTALDAAVVLDRVGATFVGERAPCTVGVRFRGVPRLVARLADRAAAALREGQPEDAPARFWQDVADAPHRAAVALRLSAPESALAPILRDAGAGFLHYHGTGIAFLVRHQASAEWVRERRLAVEAAEGSLVVERAPLTLHREVDAWGTPAVPLDLARRVKAALDPRGILSPGRFVGGI